MRDKSKTGVPQVTRETDLTEATIDSVSMASGVLIKAYRDRVRLPDGSEAVREWIDHPGASAVVPVFEDGSTILIRQYRYAARREFWEVPAGKLDQSGESPEEVAQREVEEEIGWIVGRLEHVGSVFPCIGYSNEIIHLFAGFDLSPGRAEHRAEEMVEPVRMPLREALGMVYDGRILDMKTISALLLTANRLKNR